MTEQTPQHDWDQRSAGTRPEVGRRRWVVAAWVAAAVPFAVTLIGLVGDRWFLTGDWAAIDLRIRQVGTSDTPLIGAYSTRGWAHPGPVVFYLGTPFHRLSGGDPRSMMWTAAAVNLAAIAGLAWVAWRRLSSGFAVTTLLAVALLAHGLGPKRIVDIWNPLLPLFSLLLVLGLAWSAATGSHRHGAAGIVVAALLAQAHVGMVPILAVVGLWAAGWWFLVERSDERRTLQQTTSVARWRTSLIVGAALAALAWVPAGYDQVRRTRNLASVVEYFTGGRAEPVGLGTGAGLVSRYVRLDGPWLGGPEPSRGISVVGSGPLPVLLVATALVVLAVVAWRRNDNQVAAGTSLAAALVIAAVPISARVDEPIFDYLVKWLEVVSAWAWLWIAWGVWCLARAHLPDRARPLLVPAAVAATLLASLWATPADRRLEFPAQREAPAVASIRAQLRRELPAGAVAQVEHRGDLLGNVASGIIYWLWRDGYRVVSTDGRSGLKYGPEVADVSSTPLDGVVYTVAVRYGFSLAQDAPSECAGYAGAREVARYDSLSTADRRWATAFAYRNFFEPGSVTRAERRRAERLASRDLLVTMWAADGPCSSGP